MRKTYIATVILIVLLISAVSGYYYVHLIKEPKKECAPCETIASMASGVRTTYISQRTPIDTMNVGYWLVTFEERPGYGEPLNEEWEDIIFSISIDDNITINCSGNKNTVSYYLKGTEDDSPREYYLCEANPGSARYDRDFGIDGETNVIDSYMKNKHMQTLENVTIAIIDQNGNGRLDYRDIVYIFRQFYLPDDMMIEIDGEDLILFCDNGNQLFIARQTDLNYD